MKQTQTTLSGNQEESLYYQAWWPSGAVRALILVIHGAAEHGGRYEHFASRVGRAGFAVAAVDLPGHGRSSGARCCVKSFDTYIDAVARAKAQALSEGRARSGHPAADAPSIPVVVLGHSMGGLVASLYVHHDSDLIGAVFSGAALSVDPEPSTWQRRLLRAFARWLPSLGLLKLDSAGISRDAEVVAQYRQDPLVYTGKLSASLLAAMFAAMELSKDRLAELTLPVLALHGEADTLVPPGASKQLYAGVSSEDKTLTILPDLYHEVFNEPEGDEVIEQVVQWIEQRLPAN